MVLPVTIILHFQTPMSTLGRKSWRFQDSYEVSRSKSIRSIVHLVNVSVDKRFFFKFVKLPQVLQGSVILQQIATDHFLHGCTSGGLR